MKKAFLLVSNDLVADQRVMKMAEVYRDLGWDPVLVGRDLKGDYADVGFAAHRIQLSWNRGPLFYLDLNLRFFLFLVRQKQLDLVVSNDTDTLLCARLAKLFKSFAWVYDSHEYFEGVPEIQDKPLVRKVWRWIENFSLPKVDLKITVSKAVSVLFQDRGFSNFEIVRNVPKQKMALAKKRLPDGELHLLYPGMLNPGRGLDELLEAMAQLKEQPIHLTIMGEGSYASILHQKVRQLDLESRVSFTGKRPYQEVWERMHQCDLGIVLEKPMGLSFQAALPNKIFDFMQAGVPVLAGAGLPEVNAVLKEVPFGIQVEVNASCIASELKGLLSNKQRLKELGEIGQKEAHRFTWEEESEILKKGLRPLL